MSERAQGGALPSAVWDAMYSVASEAVGRKAGRRAVASLANKLGGAKETEAFAQRLAALVKPEDAGAASRGWLDRAAGAGELTAVQVRAAREIGRAVGLIGTQSASGLRAIDTTKLVVDGGRLPDFSLGGVLVMDDVVRRYQAWVGAVRGLGKERGAVCGSASRSPVWIDALVRRVLVDGDAPFAVDVAVGLRRGRTKEIVLAELQRYAKLSLFV